MNRKTKDNLEAGFYLLLVFVVIAAVIAFDIYRWHTFQDVTNSEIGYFK